MPKHDWQYKQLDTALFMILCAECGKHDSNAYSEVNARSRVDELQRKAQAKWGANRRARKARKARA